MTVIDIPPELQFINGEWAPARAKGTYAIVDPATQDTLHAVALAQPEDVGDAVESAKNASQAWAETSATERGTLLRRWANLIMANVESLAAWEAQDVGKPLSGGRMNIYIAYSIIDYYAGAADKLTGATLPTRSPNFFGYTVREPHGVCAVIIPWNVPTLLAAANIAPALAAGNTVVLKPSEVAPLAPLALVELARQAGFPPGVLNAIVGTGAQTGEALTTNPDVNHISFVGSTHTGRAIMKAAAQNLTPVKMELGGKSPNVLFADADMEIAIPAIVKAITENSGQNCNAGSRLLVEKTVRARVVEQVSEEMKKLRLGPWDQDLDMGPLASKAQFDKVTGHFADARSQGARAVTGGRMADAFGADSWYVEPTLYDQVDPSMRVLREEVFGPVLTVQSFSGQKEVTDMMNATDYGLMATLWTNDISAALRLANDVHAGQVTINQFGDAGAIGFPFNSQKNSGGFGRGGYAALDSYTLEKAVGVKLLDH